MKKITFTEAAAYDPPGHHGMTGFKLQDRNLTGTKKFWMGLSHFLPNGGAEWAYEDSPTEKIYFVLEGQLSVRSKSGTITLNKYDSLYIPPFEGREIINLTNLPASVLVTVTYPD